MKIRFVQILSGLLMAGVAYAQNTVVPLQYNGYDPGTAYVWGWFCNQAAPLNPGLSPSAPKNGAGFIVNINWNCALDSESPTVTITGSLEVDFSSQLVFASTTGGYQDFTFSPALTVTANAKFTVLPSSPNYASSLSAVVLFPNQGGTTDSGFGFPSGNPPCSGGTGTASAVSLSCSIQEVDGFLNDAAPPLYIGVDLSMGQTNTGSPIGWDIKVYGKFSQCTGAECSAAPSVQFDHIEVVQVIQDAADTVPLVPGKTTVVRVYGKANNATPVTASLTLTAVGRNMAPLTLPPQKGTIEGPTPDPNLAYSSFNFVLPDAWTSEGQVTLAAQFTPQDGSPAPPVYKFTPPPFKYPPNWPLVYSLLGIPVCEQRTDSPEKVCAASAPLSGLGGFMSKILPVGEQLSKYSLARTMLVKGDQNLSVYRVLPRLALTWGVLVAYLGSDAPDYLVAWVPHQGDMAGSFLNFSYFGPEWGRWAVVVDDSFQFAMDAELGTAVASGLGAYAYIDSVNSIRATQITGFDPGFMQIKSSFVDELNNISEATRNNASFGYWQSGYWVSRAQYCALYNAFGPTPSCAAAAVPQADAGTPAAKSGVRAKASAAATPSQYLIITGSVPADGSAASFGPGFLITSVNAGPASDPSGNYCVHFASSSAALGDYCFTASFQTIPGDSASSATFGVYAPYPSGTTRVSLVVNSGANQGTELAAITKSATAPTVTITSPHTGDHLNGGPLTITWTGSAAGGAALTYNLLSSADGGATWMPVDVGITDTQYEVDGTQIAGGSQVMFQVAASDGLNTGTATVGPLTLTQTPQISVPTGVVSFGLALLGASADVEIPIGNTGTGPLTVSAVTFDNSAFSLVAPALPFTVNVGAQNNIEVRFYPSAAGAQSGTMKVASNDTANTPASVSLSANAVSQPVPVVSVAVTTLDCGTVTAGQSTDATLTVSNLGPGPLTVSGATTTNTEFSATAPAVPFTVDNYAQQAVTIHFAPPASAAGAQSATLTLTTNDPNTPTVTVKLTGTATAAPANAPQITAGGIVNAASYTTTLARGSLATIFGTNLATSTAQASGLLWGTSLGGASVTVGGVAAPLYYASPTQINFQVPYEVPAGSSANVVVTSGGVAGAPTPVAMADYAVGVFTYARTATAVDPIVVHYSNNQLVTPTSPAVPGEILVVYGTGIGKLNNPPPTGVAAPVSPLATPVDTITMTLGGTPVSVLWTGLTPGCAGLIQMDIQLPATLPAGSSLPMVIQFPGGTSPAVNLAVQASTVSAPKLTLSSNTLAFGSVIVGQFKDLSVTVFNTGTAALNVSAPAASGTGFSVFPAVSAFTLQPGGTQTVTVRYTPAAATSASGTLTIASDDSASPATVALSGTGVAPGPTFGTVVLSDSFNRANATACALGKADLALGGSGSYYYLPIFSTTGVSIVSAALQNNTLDFAGVQVTATASCGGSGETLLQDLYMRVDVLVPASAAGVVQAGPYFRSRAAAPADGIIGGTSAGYWVVLTSAGEVRVRGLNPNAVIATTGVPASFNAAVFHTLETVAKASSLQVWLDGVLLTFTQNGAAVSTVALPATAGSNNGTAGIGFADDDNRGMAGGQRAKNLVIAQI